MIRAAFVALIAALLPFSALGQVNWSGGVVYEYDGSGNVRKIGTDTYLYDTAQRLIRGSVAGSQQSYTYDSFGNRKACEPAAGGDCQYGFEVDSATNRVQGRTYDKRGNMLQLPEGNTLEYDELGMVRKESGTLRQVYYIYTADDERIAVYETANTLPQTHNWQWTVRGLDKKPLREFTSEGASGTSNFKWAKDHIWRDSLLLASRQADANAPGGVSTYHYHVDHLGTPRQVTNSASVIIGRHDYLPFGPELTSIDEPKLQDLKFTGHERDEAPDRPPLDYMHARYYEPRLGRFLSVDPTWESADLGKPQTWNRYSYVLNNPVNFTDPDGRMLDPRAVKPEDLAKQIAKGTVLGILGGLSKIAADYVLPDGHSDNSTTADQPPRNADDLLPSAKPSRPSVQDNKKAGDAFRDQLAEGLKAEGREVKTEVVKKTPFGPRRIDIEVSQDGKVLGGIETKVGNSRYTPSQRAKDWWLRKVEGYVVTVVRKVL